MKEKSCISEKFRKDVPVFKEVAEHRFAVFRLNLSTGYYAALLPGRGPHIASHSVCLSVVRLSIYVEGILICIPVFDMYVRLSVCPSVPLSLPSVTSRHLANYNDTHVLFGTR